MALRDFFVGSPRPGQVAVLQELDECIGRSDVVVIRADVGEGKSKLAECLVRAAASTRGGLGGGGGLVCVPNNVLLDQYLSSCRGLDTLRRADLYRCSSYPGSCRERKEEVGRCCVSSAGPYAAGACPYLRDLRRARSSGKMVLTYHAAMAHSIHRPTLVVDEAHNLRPFLRELAATRLWKHDYGWSKPVRCIEDVLRWLGDIPSSRCDQKTDLLWATATGPRPEYMVDFSPQEFRGVERECISLIPLDVKHRASPLWPGGVRRIILMSATINRIDIAALGLDRRRVSYIEAPSSIPPERRQVIYHPVADMRFSGREEATERMAKWILEEFLPAHPGEKGLIHATYAVAAQLRELAPDHPRLLFHGVGDKKEVLDQFLAAPPGAVLVGSGMYEGLDLHGDRARFQLITQVPRPSVGDPATAWLAENKPEEYEWETVRSLVQATGRVCRGADDYGVTVIADSSFGDREARSPLLPASWLASLAT